MRLLVELDDGNDRRLLAIDLGDGVTVGQLARELVQIGLAPAGSGSRTLAVDRTRVQLDPEARIAETDLRAGDLVRLVVDSRLAHKDDLPAAATVTVHSADGRTRTLPLVLGEHTIGRGRECDIVLDDPLASRLHAKLVVTDVVVVVDMGSTNGVEVGGEPISRPRALQPGDRVVIGDTVLSIVHHNASPHLDRPRGGVIEFNRPPRLHRPFGGVQIEVPAAPQDPARQRLPMIAALAPLLMGAILFAVTRNILSVLFIGLSPLMVVASAVESRRSGRADFADRLAEFREDLAQAVENLERARAVEIESRHDEAPSVAVTSEAASALSPRLWERSAEDPDFLHVRLGTAEQPSRSIAIVRDGGGRRHRHEAEEVPGRFALVPGVPVVVGLPEVGGFGIAGPRAPVSAVARSVLTQIATLHSPVDVVICALLSDQEAVRWRWLQWLPHTRSPLSPIRGGNHLAASSHAAHALLGRLDALFEERQEQRRSNPNHAQRALPHVHMLIDESLPVERSRLTALLEDGPAVGISFTWLGSSRTRLPAACRSFLEIDADGSSARAGYRATGELLEPVRFEGVPVEHADTVARRLAPIKDVSSRSALDADLPASAPLVELIGGEPTMVSREPIIERWRESQSLRSVAGVMAGGPFIVDLRRDGPHALVAGTTGAGKSELLQSLVVSLAVANSPERITFLLVDYKGGAAFKDCVHLPHTVGLVTDLDKHEVRRALVSLEAELHHRERLLNAARAKDLQDMERQRHPDTPPSLLIVVDEFAALAREVPEFVEGVVNVAQRGRSLGLHLVLATQRPAGVITDNIRANTNLRIALRVADDTESADVIGSPVAAGIERSTPGRAFAKVGPRELIQFQSAYVGGRTRPGRQGPSIRVTELHFDHEAVLRSDDVGPSDEDGYTDLQRLVANLRTVSDALGLPPPRRPWLAPLAARYDLARLPRARSDAKVPIGALDCPERQRQEIAWLDLSRDGSALILGTSGSGKTVLLRTIAAGLSMRREGSPVHVYGLDFAGRGLQILEALPPVGSVIAGDDHERIVRLLRTLQQHVADRGAQLAGVRAADLVEYRRIAGDESMPRIVVLLDGYPAFHAAYERIDGGIWVDLVPWLIADGRAAGLHFVVTSDRRTGLPMSLWGSVQRKIFLRMASEDEYASAGVPADAVAASAPPGRGYLDGYTMQAAILGGVPSGEAQADAIHALGTALGARMDGADIAPTIGVLPEEVRLGQLPIGQGQEGIRFGVSDRDLGVVALAADDGHLTVAGPPRSGRTTALATIAQSLASGPVRGLFLITARSSLLHGAPWWTQTAIGTIDGAALFRQLLVDQPWTHDGRVVLVVDDLTDLSDGEADMELARLLTEARTSNLLCVAAVESGAARRAYGGSIPILRNEKRALLLQPNFDTDGDLVGVHLPRSTRLRFPPGRGYFVDRGVIELVQVALPEPW